MDFKKLLWRILDYITGAHTAAPFGGLLLIWLRNVVHMPPTGSFIAKTISTFTLPQRFITYSYKKWIIRTVKHEWPRMNRKPFDPLIHRPDIQIWPRHIGCSTLNVILILTCFKSLVLLLLLLLFLLYLLWQRSGKPLEIFRRHTNGTHLL